MSAPRQKKIVEQSLDNETEKRIRWDTSLINKLLRRKAQPFEPKPLIQTIHSFKQDTPDDVKKAALEASYLKHHDKLWNGGIDQADEDGKTPLIHAVSNGDLFTVRWLCQHKNNNRKASHQDPKPNHFDKKGKNALMYAIIDGHTAIVNSLVGITDLNQPSPVERLKPLAYAIREKNANMQMVKQIDTQARRKHTPDDSLLIALARSPRLAELKELTSMVFLEMANAFDRRRVRYECRMALDQEPLDQEKLQEFAVDYKRYEHYCLSVLQVALEEQKFNIIPHLFLEEIQWRYQAITDNFKNALWDALLTYAIDASEALDLGGKSKQANAFEQGIYEFIKLFLVLAKEKQNTVFLRHPSWVSDDSAIFAKMYAQAKQKNDTQMLTLLQASRPPKSTNPAQIITSTNVFQRAINLYRAALQKKQSYDAPINKSAKKKPAFKK